jgi:glucose-1-phosphate cytidylyltransferase
MKAVILCGGLGTRLREETEFRPKPLVEVGGRPILWHIMKIYAHFGVRQFVVCLGYKGQMIKEYFLNYEGMNNDFTIHLGGSQRVEFHGAHGEQDYAVTLADTGEETMTGGRVKRVAKYIGEDEFMVTYGDGVADVDLDDLLAFHRGHGKVATLTAVSPPSRFGILELGDGSQVVRFDEKPKVGNWINAGFFVFNRKIFDHLGGDTCVLEREPLERLAAAGELMAYRHEGFFFAMDTYREYKALNDLWHGRKAPWKVWQE